MKAIDTLREALGSIPTTDPEFTNWLAQTLKDILAAHECEYNGQEFITTFCGSTYKINPVDLFKFCPYCGGVIKEVVK